MLDIFITKSISYLIPTALFRVLGFGGVIIHLKRYAYKAIAQKRCLKIVAGGNINVAQ